MMHGQKNIRLIFWSLWG